MIRPLIQADIPDLLRIETSVHVSPWTEETFKACFKVGYIGWAIESDNTIIGFIIVSLTTDECHILNLCVARSFQHQGLGKKLLQFGLNHASKHGMGVAYLEVRRSNTRAISLYQKLNFHLIGERKGYYSTVAGEEDALIFAIQLHHDAV